MKHAAIGLLLAAAAASAAQAHHSYGAIYLEQDSVEIEGRIVEFQYRNPHSFINVAGQEKGFGPEKLYAGEWVSTSQLERAGISKTTLQPGDAVRIWGSPAKDPKDNRIHVKRIERSDGWAWRGRRDQDR
jgi:hypothetical protein